MLPNGAASLAATASPGGGLHHRREAARQQVPRLADVHQVEDDPLVLLCVLDAEVEPEPEWVDRTEMQLEQIVFY